jgi:hypothetical protein
VNSPTSGGTLYFRNANADLMQVFSTGQVRGTCTGGSTCVKYSTGITNDTAIWGESTGSNGYGVFGSGKLVGVEGGIFTAGGKAGVWGYAVGTYGVIGESTSTGGHAGVWGKNTSTSGNGIGVTGTASGTNSTGVSGVGDGFGVYGYSSAGYGVYGDATNGTGWALYSKGKFKVEGTPFCSTQTTFTINSDARLKTNIKPLEGALDRLMQLKGVTYEWKNPAEHDNMRDTQRGFIAQDVEKVFPEWVGTDDKGFKTLTTRGLEAMVVESLRTLKTENEALRDRVKALEGNRRTVASIFSGDHAEGLTLGLFAFGAIATLRKRRTQKK